MSQEAKGLPGAFAGVPDKPGWWLCKIKEGMNWRLISKET